MYRSRWDENPGSAVSASASEPSPAPSSRTEHGWGLTPAAAQAAASVSKEASMREQSHSRPPVGSIDEPHDATYARTAIPATSAEREPESSRSVPPEDMRRSTKDGRAAAAPGQKCSWAHMRQMPRNASPPPPQKATPAAHQKGLSRPSAAILLCVHSTIGTTQYGGGEPGERLLHSYIHRGALM
eukprot:scaffold9334_cov122-Isochrysis_galbana.AAC.3